jgi:hypothetical protein
MRGPTVVESPERVTLSDENKVFVREASRPNIHQRRTGSTRIKVALCSFVVLLLVVGCLEDQVTRLVFVFCPRYVHPFIATRFQSGIL